jgi:hypothetical protein
MEFSIGNIGRVTGQYPVADCFGEVDGFRFEDRFGTRSGTLVNSMRHRFFRLLFLIDLFLRKRYCNLQIKVAFEVIIPFEVLKC